MNSATQFRDVCGVPVTAQNAEAAQALECAIVGLTSHRADTAQQLERALTHDPELLLAHVVRGFGLKFLGRSDLATRASAACACAEQSWSKRNGTPRERLLASALSAWCKGDPIASLHALEATLRAHPLDRLALKLSHALYFYLGMRSAMRESLERVLAAWQRERPQGLGRVLGCYAFALAETGEPIQGERIGRSALAFDELDPWGVHATVHAIHAQARTQEALDFLRDTESHLVGANNFRGHAFWHRAVLHTILGQWDEALALYDREIAIYPAHDYRDLVNEVTLLHRCVRAGVHVGTRAERCATTAKSRLGDHGSAFADVHHVLALSLAGEHEQAAEFITSMRAHAAHPRGMAEQVLREVALPVANATRMIATSPARALHILTSMREALPRLGGSRAQHAVFALLEADALRQIRYDENNLHEPPSVLSPLALSPLALSPRHDDAHHG